MINIGRIPQLFVGAALVQFILLSPGSYASSQGALPPPATFASIPEPKSTQEVDSHREDRTRLVLQYGAVADPAAYVGDKSDQLAWITLSHLEVNEDVSAANRAILDNRTYPYAPSGTSFSGLGPFCKRKGDYDFALRAWVFVAYRFWSRPDRLWPESRRKLLDVMLNERGNSVALRRRICGIPIPETENHILMTESSRYLTNQLLNRDRIERGLAPLRAYDNEFNGMNHFLRRHLAEFLKSDFSEYNSVPYQGYTTMPLLNLAEFSEDPMVRVLAKMVLTSLDIKTALGSAKLLRFPPFRRRKEYRDRNPYFESDAEATRGLMLAGLVGATARLSTPYRPPSGYDLMSYFGLSEYKIQNEILDWYFAPEDSSKFHSYFRMKHRAVEIVSKAPEYILSAGGTPYRFHVLFPKEAGWVVPTMLIPAKGRPFVDENIRFLGQFNEKGRSNTCVGPHFFCGVNIRWPKTLPEHCVTRQGNWAFINAMSEVCPELGWDIMVAVRHDYCRDRACSGRASNWGFGEVYSPKSSSFQLSFAEFQNSVLTRSQGMTFGPASLNTYTTLYGDKIQFRPLVDGVFRSSVESINEQSIPLDMRQWPYIRGTHWNADGRGRMDLIHPLTQQKFVIDATNADDPQWYSEAGAAN